MDDEEGIRATLPVLLRQRGFDVRVAADVAEALSEMKTHDFDVLLSDLNIGQDGDGFAVIRAMRNAHPGCVAFLLTGYPGFESSLQALHDAVLDGSKDNIEAPPPPDPNGNEIDPALVDHLEFYLLNYFKPGIGKQDTITAHGQNVFNTIGCTSCHIQNLQIDHDRRVADLQTVYDPVKGIFNTLFSTATALFNATDDGSGFPTLKQPQLNPFLVQNIFTDFKRHDIGVSFYERSYDGTLQTKFLTRPLWGVGSTGPYGHDGRSMTLDDVILRHGGESQASRAAYAALSSKDSDAVLKFLNSLILFPPDDTASNLDLGNPSTSNFPQFGHGSIKLTVLFNNPTDVE